MCTTLAIHEESFGTPDPVAIGLLGLFRLSLAGSPALIGSESKTAQLLLCLAIARPHRLSRIDLLERIWPQVDPGLAAQSLNSLVYALHKLTQKVLGSTELVLHEQGAYQLNMNSGVWIDLDKFETWHAQGKQLFASGDDAGGVDYYRKALTLYQGDLCGGHDLKTVIERERLRVVFLNMLARLADVHFAQGCPAEALDYLQRLIAHEPCREDAHRLAMRCYVQLDQRAQALRQYRLCCQALALEFNAQPEPATTALYERIRLDPARI